MCRIISDRLSFSDHPQHLIDIKNSIISPAYRLKNQRPPQGSTPAKKKEAPAGGAAGAVFAWGSWQYSSFRIGAADSESFFDLAPDFIADFCRHFSRYYLSMFFIAVFHSMITSTPFKKQYHQAPQASRNNLLKKPIFCMLVFI